MTTGEGIFWAGVFYLVVNLVAYGYTYLTTKFPNKQVARLEKLEKMLRDNGIEGV